jgi:hypothetical protein
MMGWSTWGKAMTFAWGWGLTSSVVMPYSWMHMMGMVMACMLLVDMLFVWDSALAIAFDFAC